MKKNLLGFTLASLLFTTGSAVAAEYKIDKEGQHAFVNFRIQHLGYSWLYGTFKDFDGTFTFDEKNPSADKVNVTNTCVARNFLMLRNSRRQPSPLPA